MNERLGYKVVTGELKSLGLRKNPHILTFAIGDWLRLPIDQVQAGKGDWGGIWAARTLGSARTLVRYMNERYEIGCRIFISELGLILYENTYRVKTDAIRLQEEVK